MREPNDENLRAAVKFALSVSLSEEYRWIDYMRDLYHVLTGPVPPSLAAAPTPGGAHRSADTGRDPARGSGYPAEPEPAGGLGPSDGYPSRGPADQPMYELSDDDEPLKSWNIPEHAARVYKANTSGLLSERIDYCTSELRRRLEGEVDRLARNHGLTRAELLENARRVLSGTAPVDRSPAGGETGTGSTGGESAVGGAEAPSTETVGSSAPAQGEAAGAVELDPPDRTSPAHLTGVSAACAQAAKRASEQVAWMRPVADRLAAEKRAADPGPAPDELGDLAELSAATLDKIRSVAQHGSACASFDSAECAQILWAMSDPMTPLGNSRSGRLATPRAPGPGGGREHTEAQIDAALLAFYDPVGGTSGPYRNRLTSPSYRAPMRAALKAALAADPAGGRRGTGQDRGEGWQPIETAPSEPDYYTELPSDADGGYGYAKSVDGEEMLFLLWWESDEPGIARATRWRPLPEPPADLPPVPPIPAGQGEAP